MANVNLQYAAKIPVYNAEVPKEGPIGIQLLLDFTANQSYSIDGKMLVDQGYISLVQTLFVDTTGCTQNLIVTIDRSNQKLIMKPNTQGYYPALCPNPFRLTFTCTGGPAGISVILLNMPIAPGQWATV